MSFAQTTHARPSLRRRGFTLIEAALVTSIIGFGVMSMLTLLASGTAANNQATELTMGLNLAKNIREMSLGLQFADPTTPAHWGPETGETLATYDDVDDLDGRTFSPPIDARRQTLSNYSGWAQQVTVETVDPALLTGAVPKGSAPGNRVIVNVTHNGKNICSMSWMTFDTTN